jgi:hypothetical protein
MDTAPRRPRSSSSLLADLLSEMRSQGKQLEANTKDTREARDGMLAIKATMDAQDVGGRLAEMEKRISGHPEAVRTIVKAAMADAAVAADKALAEIKDDVVDHDRRLTRLEAAKSRTEGADGLIQAFLKHLSSSLAGAGSALAALFAYVTWRHPHH